MLFNALTAEMLSTCYNDDQRTDIWLLTNEFLYLQHTVLEGIYIVLSVVTGGRYWKPL